MVKAEVVKNKSKRQRKTSASKNWWQLLLGVLCVLVGIAFIWDLAWEFIKFGIGLVLILVGLGFLGSRQIIRMKF